MKRMLAAATLLCATAAAAAAAAAPSLSVLQPKETHRLDCAVKFQGIDGVIIVRNTTGRILPLDAAIEIRLTVGRQYPISVTKFVRVRDQAHFPPNPTSMAPGESRWLLSHAGARSCSARVTLSRHFAR